MKDKRDVTGTGAKKSQLPNKAIQRTSYSRR